MFTKVIDTQRGPVEYTDAGAGEPILYFHGTGVTGDVMAAIEARLSEDDFRLIIPNRPGYGKTPLSSHNSANDCADVAAALLDRLGLNAVSVMGSSGGAAFAVAFAVKHSGRAKSLVLLCPQLHRWDHKRWLPVTSRWTLPFLKRTWLRKLLLGLYRFHLPRMSVQQFLKTEAGDRFADVAGDPAAQRLCQTTLAALAQGTKYAGFENDLLVFTNEDIMGADSSLQTPTLVIHDVKDPMAPVDHVDWFAAHVPGCERVCVHTAGHLIWVGPDADRMHARRVRFLKDHLQEDGCSKEEARWG